MIRIFFKPVVVDVATIPFCHRWILSDETFEDKTQQLKTVRSYYQYKLRLDVKACIMSRKTASLLREKTGENPRCMEIKLEQSSLIRPRRNFNPTFAHCGNWHPSSKDERRVYQLLGHQVTNTPTVTWPYPENLRLKSHNLILNPNLSPNPIGCLTLIDPFRILACMKLHRQFRSVLCVLWHSLRYYTHETLKHT